MNSNLIISMVLLILSVSLIACADKKITDSTAGTAAVFKVPEFARQLVDQRSVDYASVFAVVIINGERQTLNFSGNATQSFDVVGIRKDAENEIRVEWWESFMRNNLALAHQEQTLFVASTDTSLDISSAYIFDEYDDDADGKSNLDERKTGTCPVAQPCDIVPPVMVNIPAGTFLMGAGEPGFDADEYPQHAVSVDAFSLAEKEITWAEWDICVDAGACTPVELDERLADIADIGTHPLGGVSYPQIEQYIVWINAGLGGGFRLPSEAEFEYALRAGTTTAYSYGNSIDNYCDFLNGFNSKEDCDDGYRYSSPVGTFDPNPFGLYDILGNIGEWTADCWHADYTNAPTTAIAWRDENGGDCNNGVLRGSNFYFDNKAYHSSHRRRKPSKALGGGEFQEGFRLARDL